MAWHDVPDQNILYNHNPYVKCGVLLVQFHKITSFCIFLIIIDRQGTITDNDKR